MTVLANLVGAPVTAQNSTHQTINLNSGFKPDPHVTSLQAGGPIDNRRFLSLAGERCIGYTSDAQDVRLHYTADGDYPLIFSVNSSSDTTLIVNTPDGQWYCNDDGGDGLNPRIGLTMPQSGQYDIWVGTSLPSDALVPAELEISEGRSH